MVDEIKKSIFTMFPNYESKLGDWQTEKKSKNITITSVNAKANKRTDDREQAFDVIIELNSPFNTDRVDVEVDGKIIQAFQKNDLKNLQIYNAEVTFMLPIPFVEKSYTINARLVDVAIGKIVNSKAVVVKISKIEGSGNQSGKKVTFEELKLIFTTAEDDIVNEVVDAFNEALDFFEINNCIRKAHFFAQVLKEVGSGFYIKHPESLNYPTDGLINGYWYSGGSNWIKGDLETLKGGYFKNGNSKLKSKINFSYTKKHPDIAEKYGRKDLNKYNDSGIQQANSIMLANYVYGNRKDLGNGGPETGDGNKFRGKGLIQITGRYTYEEVNKVIQKFDKNIDIINDPDAILTDIRLAVISAMGYWKWKNINKVIGTDKSDEVVNKVTKIVNRLEDESNKKIRLDCFKYKTKIVFNVENCAL
jgi:predicted chitinase